MSAKATEQQSIRNIAKANGRTKETPTSLVLRSIVLILAGTVVGLWQYTRPYYWHEPYPISSFLHPLEWNIDAGLADVPRDIRAIAQSNNGKCLWIAGSKGFLA